MEHPVVLFDGVCNLCHAVVHFVIDRDPGAVFRFAPLQGEAARRLLGRHGIAPEELDSVVLVDKDRVFSGATAALRVACRLSFPWRLLAAFMVVPAPLRDRVYDLVARRRYRWFGQRDSCLRPEPGLRFRFLEETDPGGV